MAEKDVTEKNLEAYNDVFADIVNVLLFDGKDIVKQDELADAAPNSMLKLENEIHEQERDIAKYWGKSKVRIAFYGFENQTAIDKDMPLRILSYEGAAYKAQLTGVDNAEDKAKRYPVVTLVLYFGIDRWNKYHSLKELVEVPAILQPYVNDYRINIREIAWLSDDEIASFKSDFRYVAEYFRAKRLNEDLKFDDKMPAHIDAILKLLTALSGDEKYTEVLRIEGGKPKTMCEVLDRMFKKKDIEIAELKKENADKDAKLADRDAKLADKDAKLADKDAKLADKDATIVSIIKAAMKSFDITAAEAMERLNIPEADRAALMANMQPGT